MCLKVGRCASDMSSTPQLLLVCHLQGQGGWRAASLVFKMLTPACSVNNPLLEAVPLKFLTAGHAAAVLMCLVDIGAMSYSGCYQAHSFRFVSQFTCFRSENLLRAQLVHGWQQQQQLHLDLVRHLLCDAPQPDPLLLRQPADDPASGKFDKYG